MTPLRRAREFLGRPQYNDPLQTSRPSLLMPKKHEQTSRLFLIFILFFISGGLALTYEVVWTRMMISIFGSTAVAVGTVLAAFMTGMAVGSYGIGKFADRSPNCLRLYAWLEIGIAASALVSHSILSRLDHAQSLLQLLSGSSADFGFVRFVLAFLLVMLPTVLMGATLPVLARFLAGRRTTVGAELSKLYASNTFGAVCGVLVTGFFLIGRYGIHAPVYAAVAGNLLIGTLAWLAAALLAAPARDIRPPDRIGENPGTGAKLGMTARVVLFGLGLSGFTSFAYEIYWTRSLVFILGNSTYALTTMLSAFLTGIALGGYLVRFPLRRFADRVALFGMTQVLLGISSALALPLLFGVADPLVLGGYLQGASDRVYPFLFGGFGIAFLVMLVPAMLIGATFPLAGQVCVNDLRRTGASVGRVYAVNTVGNVLGALAPGVVLLDLLGIQKGILAMATLNVALGLVVLSLRWARRLASPALRMALLLSAVLALAALSRAPLGFEFPSQGENRLARTLFYREGPSATTKVFQDPVRREKHMSVDGIVIGGTGAVEFKQLLLAHLPKLLLDDVSTELSIGVGSGILVGESLLHPRVQRITAVEIEPGVIQGAEAFAGENHDVLNNPRLRLVNDDIGNFLRTTKGTYRVITADEKTADEYASNGFSYSLDYYRLLNRHLAANGLMAQWVPSTLPPEQYRMILKTFTQGFRYVQLWYFLPAFKRGPFNSILIGSKQPIPVSYERMSEAFAGQRQAFKSLQRYGLTTALSVVPHFVADEKLIREAVASAPVNSLDHPYYEFYYPWDYAAKRQLGYTSNHSLIVSLRRQSRGPYLAALKSQLPADPRLEAAFRADDAYLDAFTRYLDGMTLPELYRLFDHVLSLAPWNDNLRARVFSIYSYTARRSRDPAQRRRLQMRADALYGIATPGATPPPPSN